MKLKKTLKQLLDLHDTTQKQLAEALSLSPSALGNYIQGTREPDYGTLIRIADYFHSNHGFSVRPLSDPCRFPRRRAAITHFPRSDSRTAGILSGTGADLPAPEPEKRSLLFSVCTAGRPGCILDKAKAPPYRDAFAQNINLTFYSILELKHSHPIGRKRICK